MARREGRRRRILVADANVVSVEFDSCPVAPMFSTTLYYGETENRVCTIPELKAKKTREIVYLIGFDGTFECFGFQDRAFS